MKIFGRYMANDMYITKYRADIVLQYTRICFKQKKKLNALNEVIVLQMR